MTWGWVNEDRTVIFGGTVPLRAKSGCIWKSKLRCSWKCLFQLSLSHTHTHTHTHNLALSCQSVSAFCTLKSANIRRCSAESAICSALTDTPTLHSRPALSFLTAPPCDAHIDRSMPQYALYLWLDLPWSHYYPLNVWVPQENIYYVVTESLLQMWKAWKA